MKLNGYPLNWWMDIAAEALSCMNTGEQSDTRKLRLERLREIITSFEAHLQGCYYCDRWYISHAPDALCKTGHKILEEVFDL